MSDFCAVIERFYAAFAKRDGDAMVACYHPRVRFSDPVFVDLDATEACAMWRMLTKRASDLTIEARDISAHGDEGSASWTATYTFSGTGRFVRNEVAARFRFEEGLIVDHRDVFDLPRWCRQALGVPGLLLGWAPPFQDKVRAKARHGLESFMKRSA